MAPGIQINWDGIKGLTDSLGKDGVCSNYSYDYVDKTWEFIKSFKGGNAVFTHPATPIKCGGAPQKIAYLADDHFRKAGVRERVERHLRDGQRRASSRSRSTPTTLTKVAARKGIDVRFRQTSRRSGRLEGGRVPAPGHRRDRSSSPTT